MSELTFAQPNWLWALLVIVPLAGLRIFGRFRNVRNLPGLVSPRLQGQLVVGSGETKRWIVFFLRMLAFASLIAALARPQWGFEETETFQKSRSLILAIDTSRSMLAEDLPPNRLERAKLAAKDIVLSLPEDRIGIIAFAGRPFLQAPLTVDHEAVVESIDQLDTEIIPRGGTNLASAVKLAVDTFEEAKLDEGALVLFSDGEALEGTEDLLEEQADARNARISILTVGVGTAGGSIIPELDKQGNPVSGMFVKDEEGQVVRSRLDDSGLRKLATKPGHYIHLGGQASLTQVVNSIQRSIQASRENANTRRRPIERFMWFLSASVVLLIGAHLIPLLWLKPRSHLYASLQSTQSASLLIASILGLSATALSNDALVSGSQALEEERYDDAIGIYEGALAGRATQKDRTRLQFGLGAAAFRKGDFERAAEAYGNALLQKSRHLRELAHYNLGNTLYSQGKSELLALQKPANPDQLQSISAPSDAMDSAIQQWESAIEHYESALRLNAENDLARHNVEVVRNALDELKNRKQQEEEQQQKQQQQEQNKEDGKSDGNEKNEKQEQQEQNNSSDQEKPENQDGKGDEQKPDSGQNPQDDKDKPDRNSQQNPDNGNQDNSQRPPEPPQDQSQNPESQPPETPPQPKPNPGEQPDPADSPRERTPRDTQVDPETGYSPSDARQILDALADETEVRPILAPSRGEKYKNW